MKKSFEELTPAYAGRKLKPDYEDIGDAVMKKYGMKLEYGDHQFMIPVVSRPCRDGLKYEAWACIMFMDPGEAYLACLRTHREGIKLQGVNNLFPEDDADWFEPDDGYDPETDFIESFHLEHGVMDSEGHCLQEGEILTDEEYRKAVEIVKEWLDAVIA